MQLDGNKKLHLSWRFIAQTLLNPTFFALNLFTIKSVMGIKAALYRGLER